MSLKKGDVIDGRWHVGREIGSGGMGIVYAADDDKLGIEVAVKVLRPEVRELAGTLDRFLREARLAAQLRSEHAVRIYGSGGLREVPYMVMELLDGACLGHVAKLRGRVAEEDAVSWIAGACDAVGEAHDAGIVHRDLKLANLFLAVPPSDAPIVKVLDFGLAKDLLSEETAITSPDDGFGTPQFMPPEQYLDVREVDARSDVWALGVCLYRLVSGVYPMRGRTMGQLCIELGQPDFVAAPVRRYAPWLSRELERVLGCALAREKDDRYPDAVHLGAALRAIGSELPRRPPPRDVAPNSCTRLVRPFGDRA